MKKKTFYILILASLLCGIVVVQTFADSEQLGGTLRQADPLSESVGAPDWATSLPAQDSLATLSALPSFVSFGTSSAPPNFEPAVPGGQTCTQLLVNWKLDILEIGGGLGTAEPWVILDDIVYYTDSTYVSPDYSLFVEDADLGDPTPANDAFAQAFWMPGDLESVRVDYYTAALDTNDTDRMYSSLVLVDPATGQIGAEITRYNVGLNSPPSQWGERYYLITDPGDIAAMDGQYMAVILWNSTDGLLPGELVLFDDYRLTGCYTAPAGVNINYLPVLTQQIPVGAVCTVPTENPPDTYDANRGIEQVDGICNTTLSQLDKQDYYTFVVTQADRYRIRIYDLPTGSNWSATVFEDHTPYPIPPGLSGDCRTTAPGDADKSVLCDLPVGEYFIKVAAGDWTGGVAPYKMKVTRP